MYKWLVDFIHNRVTNARGDLVFYSLGFAFILYFGIKEIIESDIIGPKRDLDTIGQALIDSTSSLAIFEFLFLFLIIFSFFTFVGLSRINKSISPYTLRNGELLKYGNQKNVSFRIITFHCILSELIKHHSTNRNHGNSLRLSFRSGGKLAGEKFAEAFPGIHAGALKESEKGFVSENLNWDQLSDQQRLDEWSIYDQNSGWGNIKPIVNPGGQGVTVVYSHNTLYQEAFGELFAWFVVGYVERVVAGITSIGSSLTIDTDLSPAFEADGIHIRLSKTV